MSFDEYEYQGKRSSVYDMYDDQDRQFCIEYDEEEEYFDDEDDVSDRICDIIRNFFINKEHHTIEVHCTYNYMLCCDFEQDVIYYYEKWIEKKVDYLNDFLKNTITTFEYLDKFLTDCFGELKKEVCKKDNTIFYKIIENFGFSVEFEIQNDNTIRILEFDY